MYLISFNFLLVALLAKTGGGDKRFTYLFGFAVLTFCLIGKVEPITAILMIIYGFTTQWILNAYSDDNRWVRSIVMCSLFIVVILLMLHLVPGFHNVLVIDNEKLGRSDVPFTMYVNYDKSLVGLLVLGLACKSSELLGEVTARSFAPVATAVLCFMIFAFVVLDLKIDMKWLGTYSLVFILVKSFSTALVEEIVFRGWLQKDLSLLIKPRIAWVVVSVFFGLVHFSGGASYVALAILAGLMYGYVYMKYKSIFLAGFAHALVNILHFSFLTYPR